MKLRKIANTLIASLLILFFCAAVLMSSGVFAQQPPADEDAEETQGQNEITGWRVKDFKPYVKAIQELEKLSKEYSENLLKMSIDEYSTGLDILEDMEHEVNQIKEVNSKKKNLFEQWYWQEIDRRNQEKRQISRLKYAAKSKSVTYFTRSINHMDEIQSPEVRNDQKFTNFKKRLYQVYVSTQYDLHNLKPCIPILERYIAISDDTKNDVWAYKYLASCYGYMEKVLTKYSQSSEQEVLRNKQLKNRYLLKAAELQYGVDSPQYKHLREIVQQDEKKSERINDFK
jgi:hypothetical protein